MIYVKEVSKELVNAHFGLDFEGIHRAHPGKLYLRVDKYGNRKALHEGTLFYSEQDIQAENHVLLPGLITSVPHEGKEAGKARVKSQAASGQLVGTDNERVHGIRSEAQRRSIPMGRITQEIEGAMANWHRCVKTNMKNEVLHVWWDREYACYKIMAYAAQHEENFDGMYGYIATVADFYAN